MAIPTALMPRLDELFEVRNGVPTTDLSVHSDPGSSRVAFLRPSNKIEGTSAGYVERTDVPAASVYPADSLIVSTNGQGSHTFAYVFPEPFACNSDVAVLVPRTQFSLAAKLWYARAITANRWLFSYGRKPKGERLKAIKLPSTGDVPSWVNASAVEKFNGAERPATSAGARRPADSEMSLVRVDSLCSVIYGHSLELNRLTVVQRNEGVAFVSRKMGDNGISAYVKQIAGVDPFPAGDLTVALGGNGVLSTFVQDEPYYTGRDTACLRPRRKFTKRQLLYIAACIYANRRLYSFGRQANRTLARLVIPAPRDEAGWAAVDRMMSTLPFSSQV